MAATLGVGLFDALEAVRAERQAHLNHAVEVPLRHPPLIGWALFPSRSMLWSCR